MSEVDLARSLPRPRRDIAGRDSTKTPEVIAESCRFEKLYFDGPRSYGYGGYRYDGRWVPVARDIIDHFQLKPGQRVLDVGCAKGFLVKDLMEACPGLEVFGLDISAYALSEAVCEAGGRLIRGSCDTLPFETGAFDAAVSFDTIHNLDRAGAGRALAELQRVSRGRAFVRVDSYHTQEQRDLFQAWVLTARYHDYPDGWKALFDQAGYTGDYCWTIIG